MTNRTLQHLEAAIAQLQTVLADSDSTEHATIHSAITELNVIRANHGFFAPTSYDQMDTIRRETGAIPLPQSSVFGDAEWPSISDVVGSRIAEDWLSRY